MFKIKNHFSEWYRPQGSFVVRNPLFPIERFFSWKAENAASANDSKNTLEKSLRSFYMDPIVQEALYIGSPDLHEQLFLWLDNKIEKPEKKERTELSLVKYMIRMCTRCTPYGLFASCTSGNIADGTSIYLEDKNSLQRNGRLDMDYVCQALTYLLKQREISDQLRFYPNSSLYKLGDYERYIEHRFQEQTGRSYHLVQVERSEYLDNILAAAHNGARPDELANIITGDEVSFEEAHEFIYELIQSQVLVSELEPNVTGEEYFSVLLRKLKSLQHTEKFTALFEKVAATFDQIKLPEDTAKNELYPRIVQHLRELDVPVHLKTLIQVDTYRPASSCSINKKVIDEILVGASLLKLLTPERSISDTFSEFKNAFTSRYESQWIPLVEVLDTESGIGYGKFSTIGMEESPLIDKLYIGNDRAGTTQQTDAESFKWQMYQEAITQSKTEVIIDDKVIEQVLKKEFKAEGLADSVYIMARINAASAAEIDSGNCKIILQAPSGPSGGNLLGRFCHLHPEIKNLTNIILRDEESHHPDCIYAEIVHLPESRIGNILMRPVLRAYEIPYLCGSTLSNEYQIPVTDLLVGIEENKVVLRSKRLNKKVIPRMSTAHNFSLTTLPFYQFLCDLQYQQIQHSGWHWGILENRPFLPRVSYGKYVLSKAKWILTKEHIKECNKVTDDELLQKFPAVIKNLMLPEFVLLSQGDNQLLLHLRNIYCIKLLLAEVNKTDVVQLTETFDVPGQCWVESSDGHYTGEFIFSFSKKETFVTSGQSNPIIKEQPRHVQRYFPIGSKWLYAKIYCGTKTAEKILADVLKPLTEKLLADDVIDKFFFIRYQDPGQHIRVRFHNAKQTDFWKEVLDRIRLSLEPYINNQAVHNLQFETYQREIERYGFETMELSENIFHYQSTSVLNFIAILDGDEGEQYRWQVALKAIDFILDDFHYTTEEKCRLIKILHQGFSSEFKVTSPEQKQISERFRNNKLRIEQLMGDGWINDEDLHKAISIFKITTDGYYQTIEAILSSPYIHHDIQSLNRLMGSYLHMFINKMFVSNQRKIELVIYDYLLKYYESKIAREKKQKSASFAQAKIAD